MIIILYDIFDDAVILNNTNRIMKTRYEHYAYLS